MVRLPLNKVGCYNKYNRFLSDFEQEHGRKPTPEEVQEIGGIKVSDVKEISKSGKRHLSMDAPLQAGENMTMMDTLSDNGYMKPDRELMDESLKEEILEVLGVVSGRESDILRCYYGLNDKPPLTLEEIGQEFGLTRERVRQIKERAIRRLRKTSVCRSLRGYLD